MTYPRTGLCECFERIDLEVGCFGKWKSLGSGDAKPADHNVGRTVLLGGNIRLLGFRRDERADNMEVIRRLFKELDHNFRFSAVAFCRWIKEDIERDGLGAVGAEKCHHRPHLVSRNRVGPDHIDGVFVYPDHHDIVGMSAFPPYPHKEIGPFMLESLKNVNSECVVDERRPEKEKSNEKRSERYANSDQSLFVGKLDG